ncbi:MAG: S1 RNA-binding domain-containing protein [Thiohalocapsa sp.]|nr:S1 RNA-binding domain-containing protein [Thiohalocapsa sp.]
MTDENDFEALMRELERTVGDGDTAEPRVGERIQGKVVAVGSEQVFVDIGAKAEASIDIENLKDAEGNVTVAVGDPVEAVVASVDAETGAIVLGGRHGRQVHGGAELEGAYRQGLPVEGTVTRAIKGGLEVQIAGHRAFCPASQADIRFVEDLSSLVGQHHAFRITKFEGGRRVNLVVSRRALLEEQQAVLAAETRESLKEGAVMTGTVTGMKEFGAFVDLGGVEGMVHVSELALGRVGHPQEVLHVGQQVEVAVLRIEQTGNPKRPEKIALSIRALAKDPWSDAASRYRPGTRINGKVTRTQPFGAFVELEPGLEGMVHVSELGAGRRINHPDEVLRTGQTVEVTVLQVDGERRRIGLSLDPDSGPAEVQQAPARPAKDDDGLGSLGDLLKAQMDKQHKG